MYTLDDLIFHRGRHGYVAQRGNIILVMENSVASIRSALDEGATMVEFDARINPRGSDHFPIIAHDPGTFGAHPTIVDFLDVISARCDVNIEIKDPAIWERVMEIVSWYIDWGGWRPEQFVISAFHHPTALAIKARYPHICVGAIMDAIPDVRYLDILKDGRIDNLHMEYMNADMDTQCGSPFMQRAKELAMHVWVWTVNDRAVAQRVCDWGAERIFTDKPHLFA